VTTAIGDADPLVAFEDALAKLRQLDELVIGHAAARRSSWLESASSTRRVSASRYPWRARRPSTVCTRASPEPDGTTAR